jgi:hypothetical protein
MSHARSPAARGSSEPEASLSATALGARRRTSATVAAFMSQPVREGTL